MSELMNPRAGKQPAEESTAHKDAKKNFSFYEMIFKKVIVLDECVTWSVLDSADPKCLFINWTEGSIRKVTNLSFHIDNAEFRDLLAWFLNYLGQKKLITKKGYVETKKVDKDDKWGQLFG